MDWQVRSVGNARLFNQTHELLVLVVVVMVVFMFKD
jgi:hypothetical protein